MNTSRALMAATVLLLSGTAFAQTTTTPPSASPQPFRSEADVQHNVNDQTRIENGLKSGQLSSKEAGKLEQEQAHIDRMQQRDMANGSISPQEQAQLNAAQAKMNQNIHADRTNGVTGNPNSISSQRMQNDVQRNVNQQQRIENGLQNGTVTNTEASRLEHGQSTVSGAEAHAGADGTVSARNQRVIENRQSKQNGNVHYAHHNKTQQ